MKDYKLIWNNLSHSFGDASFFVCCLTNEEEISENGKLTAAFLKEVLQITPEDRVLEIGCGVARIGKELAPSCGEWHGADISGNMIQYAAQRTQGMANVYLHELPESSLSIFPDNSFDCVYSSIVFMHLDKLEMFNYIREAYRVLAPGGRAYFDTLNILSPESWGEFLHLLDAFSPEVRPGHATQFSTPQEMEKFMTEAGFEQVVVDGSNPQLVVTLGHKAEQPGFVRPALALRPIEPKTAANDSNPEAAAPGGLRAIDLLITDLGASSLYARSLEETLAAKNKYIRTLERELRKYERARNTLPGKIAARVYKTFGRTKS